MSKANFLHEHPDFKSLIGIISEQKQIQNQLVEKDYWIMHCLWGLQKQNFRFELKGGTSLSKAYKIIHRFSEDIDIKIEPPSGMTVFTGKNHSDEKHILSRSNYFDWLANAISIPGIVAARDHAFDDSKFRNAGIRLNYESHFEQLPDVKDGVLLEVGFDDTTPNQKFGIASWAFEEAAKANVTIVDNRATEVPCYLPQYTFVEKLQTISTKFRKQQESGSFPANFMRHYYDVYRLLEVPEVQNFIGTEAYTEHKNKRFRSGDNKKISENEAFILSNNSVRDSFRQQYNNAASLYYQDRPSLDEILSRIAKDIRRL